MKINRVGKLGEIYKDLESGKTYKCTSIYRDSNGRTEYTWKVISDETQMETDKHFASGLQIKPENESEKIPEGKNSEKQIEEIDSKTSVSKKQIEGINNEPNYNHKPNKTKYTNYSKK